MVAAIADATDLSKRQADDALKALVNIIDEALKKGQDCSIPGLGKLSVGYRAERDGRNPSTGASIKIAARNVVKFKPAKSLKEGVNDAMPVKG